MVGGLGKDSEQFSRSECVEGREDMTTTEGFSDEKVNLVESFEENFAPHQRFMFCSSPEIHVLGNSKPIKKLGENS